MKLVEEKVLDLDKPLQDYLPRPIYDYTPSKKWHDNYKDLKVDSSYRKITARMCLAHTAGFPNWRSMNPDGKLDIKFTPGEKFGYSGEGFEYLKEVVQKITGKKVTLDE